MTDKQPEALRLAALLDTRISLWDCEAAAELRRLHEVNAELVEALQRVVRFLEVEDARLANFGEVEAARAALAKAQGENNE